jgi:lipopolysaccharide transport system permease protein
VPLQVGLTLGLGLLVSALHVFFRDTAQLLGMILNAWFYLTPVVYPLGLVPAGFRPWLELNPLTPLVGLYRQAFLGGETALVPGTGALALVSIMLVCLGLWVFSRLKRTFVDEI